jgi:hypothetical protein
VHVASSGCPECHLVPSEGTVPCWWGPWNLDPENSKFKSSLCHLIEGLPGVVTGTIWFSDLLTFRPFIDEHTTVGNRVL